MCKLMLIKFTHSIWPIIKYAIKCLPKKVFCGCSTVMLSKFLSQEMGLDGMPEPQKTPLKTLRRVSRCLCLPHNSLPSHSPSSSFKREKRVLTRGSSDGTTVALGPLQIDQQLIRVILAHGGFLLLLPAEVQGNSGPPDDLF